MNSQPWPSQGSSISTGGVSPNIGYTSTAHVNHAGSGSSGSFTFSSAQSNGISAIQAVVFQNDSDVLPPIQLKAHELDGKSVTMTLSPEGNIGPLEALKLTMLLTAHAQSPHGFNPLAYVRKHQLERHFKYE